MQIKLPQNKISSVKWDKVFKKGPSEICATQPLMLQSQRKKKNKSHKL